jgi:hypothetical protein
MELGSRPSVTSFLSLGFSMSLTGLASVNERLTVVSPTPQYFCPAFLFVKASVVDAKSSHNQLECTCAA